ncbi:hypothetical protein FD755_018788, partial [Muntiacus reevesi]
TLNTELRKIILKYIGGMGINEKSYILIFCELSQLLLCDLTLHFSHPVKTDDLKGTERNSPHFEESKMPDVSLASDSFLI